MRPRRHIAFGTVLAAFSTLVVVGIVVPSTAWAEGEGKRFSLIPSIRVTTVADDNVFLDDDDPESDVGVWIAPTLEASYRGRWFEVGGEIGADIRQYAQYSSLSKQFYRIIARGEAGLLPGLTVRLTNSYIPQPVELGLPDDDGRNLVQTNRTELEVRYWRELSSGPEVEAGIRGGRFVGEAFTAGVPDGSGGITQDDDFHPDFWEMLGFAEIQKEFGRRATVYTRGQARYRTFDDTSESDFGDLTLLAGLRSEWFKNLDFRFSGGFGYVSFSGVGSKQRILGEADVRYQFPRGFVLTLTANRTFTADIQGNDFTETSASIGLEKSLGTRTTAKILGSFSEYDADSWDSGIDRFGGVTVTLRRQLSRRMQATLAYRFFRNTGDRTINDFDQNRLLLSVTYRR